MVGVEAVLTHLTQSKEFITTSANQRFPDIHPHGGPTDRERMAVVYAVAHSRKYMAGRRFTLVTDCSVLT